MIDRIDGGPADRVDPVKRLRVLPRKGCRPLRLERGNRCRERTLRVRPTTSTVPRPTGRKGRSDRWLRLLRHPFFPRSFVLRNLQTLAAEARWAALPVRLQRLWVRRLLIERGRFFRAVLTWRPAASVLPTPGTRSRRRRGTAAATGYCDDCGGCCEIASGYPEFPEPEAVPTSWRRAFAEGLGPYHRFCTFLWEMAGSGRSVCAIHEWRPVACRAFEQDECRWLQNDRAGAAATAGRNPSSRWLQFGRRPRRGR